MKISDLIAKLFIAQEDCGDIEVLIGRDFCPGAEFKIHDFPDSPVVDTPLYLVEIEDQYTLGTTCGHEKKYGHYGRCLVNTCWNFHATHRGVCPNCEKAH